MAASFIGGGILSTPGKTNDLPQASHRQTLSRNVVSSRIRTHNFSGDMH